MSAYFTVNTKTSDLSKRKQYDEYIVKVKPIAESFGGRYIVRSEQITALSDSWKPDRVIVIEFASKTQILAWLSSPQYKEVSSLRVNSVESEAIIIEED